MFEMTVINQKAAGGKRTNAANAEANQKEAWFREEEQMRKKLEKSAIN